MNQLILLDNVILYVGNSFDTVPHQHHAGQICIGLSKPIRLIDEQGHEGIFESVLIPANTRHQMVVKSTKIATLFLDIQSADYEFLIKRNRNEQAQKFIPITLSRELVSALSAVSRETDKKIKQGKIIDQIMNELIEERSTVSNLDPRISNVIDQLDSHSESQIPLEKLAASVHLSPSRLLSLFKVQVGTPIRRYSLWRRIRVAMEHSVKSQSLTEGAHHAGFTDSAHFSRVFKEMYGINPSEIINRHSPVRISFE